MGKWLLDGVEHAVDDVLGQPFNKTKPQFLLPVGPITSTSSCIKELKCVLQAATDAAQASEVTRVKMVVEFVCSQLILRWEMGFSGWTPAKGFVEVGRHRHCHRVSASNQLPGTPATHQRPAPGQSRLLPTPPRAGGLCQGQLVPQAAPVRS